MRAAGPSLSQFGLTSDLATPELELWNGKGSMIQNNTGWNNDATLQAAFTQPGAFNFKPASSDSALLATLAPGRYTAQVKSTSPTDTGDVLVEVYILH